MKRTSRRRTSEREGERACVGERERPVEKEADTTSSVSRRRKRRRRGNMKR